MNRFVKIIQQPLWWSIGIVLFLGFTHLLEESNFKSVIRSDGKGYYSYLPALFLFNDPTYEQTMGAERKYQGKDFNPLYLYKTTDGKIVNKYFPGIALLQTPFFAAATGFAWLTGREMDGYSTSYHTFYFLGGLLYAILGLILFHRTIRLRYPDNTKSTRYLLIVALLGSPLIYYLTLRQDLGHLYSFFAFGLFSYLVLQMRVQLTGKKMFFLGLVTGLIVLIRPTNIVIVLLIPFLLGDAKTTAHFFRTVFLHNKKLLALGLLGFVLLFSLLLLVWKWQTGGWWIWSYSGEGFDFLHPHLFDVLFSFRVGVFVHTPLVLIAVFSTYYLYKQNRFSFLFWWIYFIVNLWIISSWWCWDYESPFGNRPFTEHLFFLLLPLAHVLEKKSKWVPALLSMLLLLQIVRYSQIHSGFYKDQRFTAASYFKSLQPFKPENKARWKFTRSCPPYGKRIKHQLLLERPMERVVSQSDEYLYLTESKLAKPRTTERHYFRVTLERKSTDPPLEDVFLVVDATHSESPKRYYRTMPLYHDKWSPSNEWEFVQLEGTIYDTFQDFDKVGIYLWNPGGNHFSIRNVRFELDTYKG